jgi:hypothetical protein
MASSVNALQPEDGGITINPSRSHFSKGVGILMFCLGYPSEHMSSPKIMAGVEHDLSIVTPAPEHNTKPHPCTLGTLVRRSFNCSSDSMYGVSGRPTASPFEYRGAVRATTLATL